MQWLSLSMPPLFDAHSFALLWSAHPRMFCTFVAPLLLVPFFWPNICLPKFIHWPKLFWSKIIFSLRGHVKKNSKFKDIVQNVVDPLPLTLILTNLFLTKCWPCWPRIFDKNHENLGFEIYNFYYSYYFLRIWGTDRVINYTK